MLFRRKTFWFRMTFGEMVPARPPAGPMLVIQTRTMRGIWGEWW